MQQLSDIEKVDSIDKLFVWNGHLTAVGDKYV